MSTTKIAYASSTAITCTLASLGSSSSAARSCVAIDNSSNLYDDAMLTVAVKTSSSALGSDFACYVYIYGSEDGTVFSGSGSEAPGTDAALTLDSPTNMKGPFVISCPSSSTTYRLVVGSVASVFGGVLPRKWGFVLQNFTGQTLDATEGNHQKTYTGITYTSA